MGREAQLLQQLVPRLERNLFSENFLKTFLARVLACAAIHERLDLLLGFHHIYVKLLYLPLFLLVINDAQTSQPASVWQTEG